ncbi:ribbon-helix-helix domain-containing protein [Roseomonas genomospecies 6]|uniref:ribbon-helix-helix domain-containing protein n=1 Tax=Roseomonas genomospecies 6 TaxID=214106 RepID=UPI0011F19C01|nr:ribbon-helix-helix domain-containing protein [Roseomonas genomospecies 6]
MNPTNTIMPQKRSDKPRSDRKFVGGFLDPRTSDLITQLAKLNQTTKEAIIARALDDLFEKEGLPRVNEGRDE